jgi:8-oxo-dGTP pyrophosphatase MutT (NUDIX family)
VKSFARILILRPGLRFLAIEQRGRDGTVWNLPGGKVEPHETPRDAAVREVFEEIGFLCNPKHTRLLCRKKLSFGNQVWSGYFYVYSGPLFAMEIREPDKILGLAWFDAAEARSRSANQDVFADVFDLAMMRLKIAHDPWINMQCVQKSKFSKARMQELELISTV